MPQVVSKQGGSRKEVARRQGVSGNYKLADDWREYEYSNARFYELQQIKYFAPAYYTELE